MSGIKADLSGKVALVTGAGRGIGKSIAIALAECGASILAVSRTSSDLYETKREIEEMKGKCLTFATDVSNITQVTEMVEKVHDWQGKIDILVNSAGINIPKFAVDITESDWDRVINTNLKGTFLCCQAVGKKMIGQNFGRIINITSQMAFVGFYKRAAYCASKGGVTQLSKALAVEWADHNITINCVAPTFIETPLTEPMFEDAEFRAEVLKRIPLKKIGKPKDVSGAVIYLASDAASMVTGSTILVDGGWVAW